MKDWKNYIITILLTIIIVSGISFLGYRESKNKVIRNCIQEKENLGIARDSLVFKLSEIPKNSVTIKEETNIGKLKKGGVLTQDKDNKAKIDDNSKINKR